MPHLSPSLGSILALLFGLFLTPMLHAEEPFDYFHNSWNVIGLKDYNFGTRVTPDNRLLLSDKSFMEFRLGRQLTPLGRRSIKQLLEGWLPIILLTTQEDTVRYDLTLWATPLPTVKDWRKAYDWPTEGENYMNWIQVRATNTGSTLAEAKFQAELKGPGRQSQSQSSSLLRPGPAPSLWSVRPLCRCPRAPLRRRTKLAFGWNAPAITGKDCWPRAVGFRCPAPRLPKLSRPPTYVS